VIAGRPSAPFHRRTLGEAETRAAAGELVQRLAAGDVVLLEGPLGVGKTTWVRGALEALGHQGPVRSPTFNLVQVFETNPRVAHTDLYRVASSEGLGLDELMADHLLLVEWPDRFAELPARECWRVTLAFEGEARTITVHPPDSP
jgi:tRNA threonylcarbamoyladenosine biosynthesis protein TsaE